MRDFWCPTSQNARILLTADCRTGDHRRPSGGIIRSRVKGVHGFSAKTLKNRATRDETMVIRLGPHGERVPVGENRATRDETMVIRVNARRCKTFLLPQNPLRTYLPLVPVRRINREMA